MKKFVLLTFAFTLCLSLFSQKTESEKVTDIRTWYKEIMSDIESYEKKMIEDPDESTEGGIINYHLKEGNVKMIKAEYYGESGNVKYSYYFRNDKLFFMFQERVTYDVPIYVDESGKGKTVENRFYFFEDKMIRWLDEEKKQVDKTLEEYIDQERIILKDAFEYLNKL